MLPLGNVESAMTEPLKLTVIAPPPVLLYEQVATACKLMLSKLIIKKRHFIVLLSVLVANRSRLRDAFDFRSQTISRFTPLVSL